MFPSNGTDEMAALGEGAFGLLKTSEVVMLCYIHYTIHGVCVIVRDESDWIARAMATNRLMLSETCQKSICIFCLATRRTENKHIGLSFDPV